MDGAATFITVASSRSIMEAPRTVNITAQAPGGGLKTSVSSLLRSTPLFTAAFDQEAGVGTYVAMESFEGSVHGRVGAFNFAHAATTHGSDRSGEYFTIVPGSGAGELAGITGSGSLEIDEDGTHR